MNKNEQNKFERLASFFHHETGDDKKMQNGPQESEITADTDFNAVKKIYEAKDLVNLASQITPPSKAWNKVHSRIVRRRPGNFMLYWQSVAAVVVIVLVISFFISKSIRQYFSEQEQFVSIVAPSGSIKTLTLNDGTDVWLNSGTVLKYTSCFSKTNRHVIVDGEALFKVTKDNKNLFTVSIGKSKVIVHGTTFNIKSYSSDDKYEVVLVEGSIEYTNLLKNVFINPGERITESKASGDLVVDHVNPENYTSWTYGKVYFDNQPLMDLTTLLEKWYDVEFEFINNDAKSYTFTGVIKREQTLDYTLKIIEMTNKVKFVKKGGKMLITN